MYISQDVQEYKRRDKHIWFWHTKSYIIDKVGTDVNFTCKGFVCSAGINSSTLIWVKMDQNRYDNESMKENISRERIKRIYFETSYR